MEGGRRIPVKLYHKMVAVIMVTSLIPLVLLSVFTLYTFNNNYLKLVDEQYLGEIEKSSTVLDYYLDSFYNVVQLKVDKSQYERLGKLTDILEMDPDSHSEDRSREMTEFLKDVSATNPYITGALFVDAERNVYSYRTDGKVLAKPEAFLRQVRYGYGMDHAEEPFLVPVHSADYYEGAQQEVLAVGKAYRTPATLGTLYIEVDPASLDVVFPDKQLYGKGYLRILDHQGNVLYERKQDVDRRAASIAANLQQLVYSREVPGKDLVISFSVDKVTVMADVYVLRGIMILVILCCVTLVLLVSSRFSRQMTGPISRMMEKMDLLKTGDFSVRLPVEQGDEIGILSERFNEMSEQLQNYINQSYVAQIKEKEAELTALKSQIYPHFLYNTLEVIRMTAFDQNDQKVADMIEALSGQMRYIIGTVQDVVPLQMEVEILRKYIWLINCRYEGRVQFEVDVEGMLNCMIPKLILQPVVENAFFHGLRPKGGAGVIELAAEESGEELTLTVMDNGAGMSANEQKQMRELLGSERPGNKAEYNWQSIGLKNVHDRLRYLYGPRYGVTFVSHEGLGTAVSVKIPKNLEER
ncbi:cache domain-containing sensor histidine kinase [Enterocloster lavalensis]|uniref:cache domain-containing sensor histidine kinase n=1 Tax=Enterocloster lavalensis TaxID=460384 RepID=UPI002666D1C9|nr:histidine kinase [Enterocloster lavalensis]